jgi:hypothetical protein
MKPMLIKSFFAVAFAFFGAAAIAALGRMSEVAPNAEKRRKSRRESFELIAILF